MSRRFNLRGMLVFTSLIGVLVAAIDAASILGVLLTVVLWASAGAWWGLGRQDRSVAYGASMAAAAALAMIFLSWGEYIAGYFLEGRPEYYFAEDGFVEEVFVVPIFMCFIYLPVAGAIGALLRSAMMFLGDYLRPSVCASSGSDECR